MKLTVNFTLADEDTSRYQSSADLQHFYQELGFSGLEVMPITEDTGHFVTPEMTVGVHACCLTDWFDFDPDMLLAHYRKDLAYAQKMQAEYVVFHITQVSYAESLTYELKHTNEEVIDACADFINRLLDGQDYDFYFLMENLWWPGLMFDDPVLTKRLLDRVHYHKKGLMLDTGHFMNCDPDLQSPQDALNSLHQMLDAHEALLPFIKGIHLQQSLSGSYVKQYLTQKEIPSEDPMELASQAFIHIFQIDQHRPFTADGVRKLVDRIDPLFVTLEYITSDREEHTRFLKEGMAALGFEK